tara:strand:+ start:352 stop:975 length:624 start_codon:yes stop_codon:yes gene_type:complete
MAINFLSEGNSTSVSKKGGKLSRQFFDLITFWQGNSNSPFRTSKQYSTFENAGIYVYDYPYAKELNPIIDRIILEKAKNPDKGAIMTDWKCGNIKEFRLISDYVLNLQSDFCISGYSLEIRDLWGQVYNEGDYQTAHNHLPSHVSFVYYVNTPKGSAPLVFDNSQKKVFSKAGQLVVFPGWVTHHVPRNRCKGRSVIAGNLDYFNES